jgi:spore maturation protein CgeB
MRIVVVDTYYPAFLTTHYAARPGLEDRPYVDQLESLLDQCFGTADAYSHYLRELGHDAVDVIANCEPLQLQWARERGFAGSLAGSVERFLPSRFDRRTRVREITLAQVAAFDPEVVYVQDLWFFRPGDLDALRRAGRLVVGQIASPPPSESRLRRFDLVTTSFPHFVERFRSLGLDAEYFPIAFYERVLDRLEDRGVDARSASDRPFEVTFVGSVHPRVHTAGVRLLERLSSELDIEIWGYGVDALAAGSPIRDRYRGQAWGLDMYEILARSRVTLNRHIDAAGGFANNMRLFEATGVGALLATDDGKNLAELFRPGEEVVSYTSEDGAVQAVKRLVEDENERVRIATAGQARTLAEHTYARRIPELVELLEARLR